MTKPLTEKQRDFIQKYIVNASRKEAAKISKAYAEFDRRRIKVAQELAKMPPEHPERQRLAQLLVQAERKADGNGNVDNADFNGAYQDLEAVKNETRSIAKGYIKSIDPDQVDAALNALNNELDPLVMETAVILGGVKQLTKQVKDYGVPGPDLTGPEMMEYRKAAAPEAQIWRANMENWRRRINTAAGVAVGLSLEATLKTLTTQVNGLQQSSESAVRKRGEAMGKTVLDLNSKAKLDGAYYTAAVIKKAFDQLDPPFEQAVFAVMNTQERENAPDTTGRFESIEKRDQQRLQNAKRGMVDSGQRDKVMLTPGVLPTKVTRPPKPRSFIPSDLIGENIASLKEAEIDGGKIKEVSEKVAGDLKKLIDEEKKIPNSDVLFDMATKNLNELRDQVGAAMGLTGKSSKWPPQQLALAEGIAKAMQKTVLDNNPNTISDDKVSLKHDGKDYDVAKTISVNGQTYTDPEMLGVGGLGTITRYKGRDHEGKDTTVVVKSALGGTGDKLIEPPSKNAPVETLSQDQKAFLKRKEMVSEMKTHRQVMGGEGGKPPPNVVDFKGTATGKDGSLHMVMEECKGGDMSNHLGASRELANAGVISPEADRALKREMIKQSVLALKAMHERGAIHNDIKAQNFLMDDKGNVKIADLGSGLDTEGAKTAPRPGTTDAYAPSDFFKKRTEESDVGMLGSMVHGIGSEGGAMGEVAKHEFNYEYVDKSTTGHKATSFDRLRNAMMDKDPSKRPTLEGLLQSSYIDEEPEDPEALKELQQAISAYSIKVGSRIGKLSNTASSARGKIALLEEKAKKGPLNQTGQTDLGNAQQDLILSLREIEKINQEPEIQPFIEAVRKASMKFETAQEDPNLSEKQFRERRREAMDTMQQHGEDGPKLPEELQEEIKAPG